MKRLKDLLFVIAIGCVLQLIFAPSAYAKEAVLDSDRIIAVKAIRGGGYPCEYVEGISAIADFPMVGVDCSDGNSYFVVEFTEGMAVYAEVRFIRYETE